MRNLPLVTYRLNFRQRTAAAALAASRGVRINELARRALLEELRRVNMGVNMAAARELTLVRDEG
jgi:hypothetical protein